MLPKYCDAKCPSVDAFLKLYKLTITNEQYLYTYGCNTRSKEHDICFPIIGLHALNSTIFSNPKIFQFECWPFNLCHLSLNVLVIYSRRKCKRSQSVHWHFSILFVLHFLYFQKQEKQNLQRRNLLAFSFFEDRTKNTWMKKMYKEILWICIMSTTLSFLSLQKNESFQDVLIPNQICQQNSLWGFLGILF